MRILVLEDDPDDWLILQQYAERLSIPECPQLEFELAGSLSCAEGKVQAQSYDVIIADFHLSDGVALDFLVAQLQRSPTLYVLLVTNDEQLVTLPEVGELLRSSRVSFSVKSDLDARRLQSELRAAANVTGQGTRYRPLRRRVLLVDDDPQEVEILRWHCEQIDGISAEIDWARDTGEALQRTGDTNYDLVLVDFRLQGELGTETIARLEDAGVKASMFLISDAPSFLGSQEALRCLGQRRAGFISKRRLDPDRIRQVLQSRT